MVKIQKRPAKVVRIKQTLMRIDNRDFKQTLRKYLVRWPEVILFLPGRQTCLKSEVLRYGGDSIENVA